LKEIQKDKKNRSFSKKEKIAAILVAFIFSFISWLFVVMLFSKNFLIFILKK